MSNVQNLLTSTEEKNRQNLAFDLHKRKHFVERLYIFFGKTDPEFTI
jgi:hypothetical protein